MSTKKEEKKLKRKIARRVSRHVLSREVLQEAKQFIKEQQLLVGMQEKNVVFKVPRARREYVHKILGTQEPILRLRTSVTDIVSTGGGAIAIVVAADVSGIVDWSSWVAVFDEYKVHRAKLIYAPGYVGATTGMLTLVVCVDYDNATALTSSGQGLSYDSYKIFGITPSDQHISEITAHPQGIPDKEWIDTSSPSTMFWFKTFLLSGAAGVSVTYGVCWVEFDIQFRQVH